VAAGPKTVNLAVSGDNEAFLAEAMDLPIAGNSTFALAHFASRIDHAVPGDVILGGRKGCKGPPDLPCDRAQA
jgi:hypothetical protein